MLGLKFDKSIRIADVMFLLGCLSAGWGMYYNTQARIDSETAARMLADQESLHAIQKAGSDVQVLSDSVVEVIAAIKELREQQTSLRIDMERVKARNGS